MAVLKISGFLGENRALHPMLLPNGMGTAKRALQRAARVADDGHIGPATIRAVRGMSTTDVLMRFAAQRLRHYTSLSTWPTYGKGWTNRVAGNLDYAADDA